MNTRQILLFLYSTPNIVGAILGLLGLMLFFLGLIQAFWFVIVLGLYLLGVVATPRNPSYDLHLKNQMTADEVRAELERLVRTVQKKLPAEIFAHVQSIRGSILSILPQIMNINSGDYTIYTIRQTALEYLPDTLQNYLNLPPAYRTLHPVREGKTAQQLLGEQLRLLDSKMKEIVIDLNSADAQKLVAHGRFLEDKFHQPLL